MLQTRSTTFRIGSIINHLFRNTRSIAAYSSGQQTPAASICHNDTNNTLLLSTAEAPFPSEFTKNAFAIASTTTANTLTTRRSFSNNSNRTFGNDLQLDSSNNSTTTCCLDSATYERVCTETLDALCDYFEELTENAAHIKGTDVSYSDGVLTVHLGNDFGTYVINRQTPNKQIWLSSPTSGPKRYDFIRSTAGENDNGNGKWIYKHSGETLHELLQTEIPKILNSQQINFMQLPYCN